MSVTCCHWFLAYKCKHIFEYKSTCTLSAVNSVYVLSVSLGVSILELVCNMEVPKGGEGWQQLRKGCLPTEFTNGMSLTHSTFPLLYSLHMTWVLCAMNRAFRSLILDQTPDPCCCFCCCCCVVLSDELQTVLKMMLASEPLERASVPQLLSLPAVRRRLWRRRLSLVLQETALWLASLYQVRPGTFHGNVIPGLLERKCIRNLSYLVEFQQHRLTSVQAKFRNVP